MMIKRYKFIKQIFILILFNIVAFQINAQNYALYFNSENSLVYYPEVFLEAPAEFTLEYRIKPSNFTNYNNRIQGGESNWAGAFTLHNDADGGFFIGNDVETRLTPYEDIPANTATTNEWQHYAITYDNLGVMRFYRDGVLIASKPDVSASLPWNGFFLGFPYVANGSISGTIDEVRLWNVAKSQIDIQSEMAITIAGNETGLFAYWNFDNDSGNNSMDNGPNNFNGEIYDCSYILNDDPNFQGNNIDMIIDTCLVSSTSIVVDNNAELANCLSVNVMVDGTLNAMILDSIYLNISSNISAFIDSCSVIYGKSDAQLNNADIYTTQTLLNGDNQIYLGKELSLGNNLFQFQFYLNSELQVDDYANFIVSELIISEISYEPVDEINTITVVEIPEIISEHSVWFDYPANNTVRQPWQQEEPWMLINPDLNWEQHALPIGNSFLGAMIYGSIEEERIQFNEKSLWDGGPNVPGYSNPNKLSSWEHLQDIRDLVLSGDTIQANQLSQQYLTGNWSSESINFGNYQTFGDLIINTGIDNSEYSNYKRVLSLDSALLSVQFSVQDTLFQREYFCSYPDQVFVAKFSANKAQAQNLEIYIETPHTHTITETESGFMLVGNLENNQMQIVANLEVRQSGGSVSFVDNKLIVSDADQVVIIMACDTDYSLDYPSFNGTNPISTTQDILTAVESKNYEVLKEMHLQDYQNLFNRVEFTLNNDYGDSGVTTEERVNAYKAGDADYYLESLFFHFGRYLMISSSREGDLPANLQGVWNNRIYPGWNSDYHLNINLQMNYWITGVCNLSECFTPLVDYVEMLQEPGSQTAQAYFNASGWCSNLVSNPFGFTAPSSFENMYWSFYPVSGAWLCQNIWDHYEFTRDIDYLQNKAYPILKSASQFASDYLYEIDNELVTCPSWSPEHGGISIGVAHERQVIWDLLNNTIEAAIILNVDSNERQEWIDTRDMIKPIDIGQYGQIQEWYDDIDDPNDHHRHIAHLYAVHPGKQIAHNIDPELANAAEISLNHRGDLSTGWSMAWKSLFWARLGDGNRAYELIQTLMRNEMLPNLFDKCEILFNIDGNFGAPAAMAEMLIQSHLDTIFLLPALPDAWQSGNIKGLKARGNYEFDFIWNNGAVESGTILASQQDTCRLVFNDCFVEFLAYSGEEYVIDCDILTHNNDIENSEKLSPIIYPNPSNNEFTLILNDDDYISGQITIFDITGKTVLSECANKMEQIINVSNLKSGIYTVQIIKENRIKILKLILRN